MKNNSPKRIVSRAFALSISVVILIIVISLSVLPLNFTGHSAAQDYNGDYYEDIGNEESSSSENSAEAMVEASTDESISDSDPADLRNDNFDENGNNQSNEDDGQEKASNDNQDDGNPAITNSVNDNNTNGVPDIEDSNENSIGSQNDGEVQDTLINEKLSPVADAGNDIVTYEEDTVTLSGDRSTDYDGEIQSFFWSQVDGPEQLVIRNRDSSFPAFEAPLVTSDTTFRFELMVIDNDGLSDIDSVDLTVSDRGIDTQQDTDTENNHELDSNSTFFSTQGENEVISTQLNSTELFNMTGPITNGTEVQPMNSTELFNMTGPITNGTEVQPMNTTELLNLNNTIFNGTRTNPLNNNNSSVDPESLSASLQDSESGRTTEVNLLSYSVNNTEIRVSELGNEIEFSLNNSAAVSLIPSNSSTALHVISMKISSDNGTNKNLVSSGDGKWIIDAPRGRNSLLIDARYYPGNRDIQYGAIVEVVGKENISPVADAGEDKVVSGNISVTLDGSKSFDPDGTITSFHWIQAGADRFITLTGVDTPNPSFVTPSNLKNDSNILFRLEVTDNAGGNSTDDVNILIRNTTQLPTINGTVFLEPVPREMTAGDYYEFKGILNLSKIADGSYVQIRNGNGGEFDELLTFGPVDDAKNFKAPWTAVAREEMLNIYAIYQDNSGNTLRSEAFPSKVIGFKSSPGSIQNNMANSMGLKTKSVGTEPFMEIHYSDWNKDGLNIYILAIDPSSQRHIKTAKSAVSQLSSILKDSTGNTGSWNFNVFTSNGFPSPSQTASNPINILFSLSSTDDGIACGYSSIVQRKIFGYVPNQIFTSPACGDVYRSTMHEFLHALGLGHTWHEVDDMMCSTEWFLETGKWTCDNDVDPYNDPNKPSEFNVRALLYAYGINGFQEPNGNIREDYDPRTDVKYYCTPLPCEPGKTNGAPIADAGPARSARIGEKVSLDGSKSSDSDGVIDSFSWTQIEGPNVKVYNSASPKPFLFIPSDLSSPTKFAFQLTVIDDQGLRAADSVDVNAILSEPIEDDTKQKNGQVDTFKILVRLYNINQELGYNNSAMVLKGKLFQKQKLTYENDTTGETTFVFPSALIKAGEKFAVCVEQSSISGEEGIGCKIGNHSSFTQPELIEFVLPESGKLPSDLTSFTEASHGPKTLEIVNQALKPNNKEHVGSFILHPVIRAR